MKKIILTSLIFILFVISCQKKDPDKVFESAKNNYKIGNYEGALKDHIWFHNNALKHKPSLYGVRLSYALCEWVKLGEKYPPALDKLIEIRDKKTDKIKHYKKSYQLFHDVESINNYLNESYKTVELFKYLDENNNSLATEYYNLAKEALIEHHEYKICNRYITDLDYIIWIMKEGLEANIRIYNNNDWAGEEHLNWAIDTYLQEADQTLLILTKNNRFDEAENFIKQAYQNIDIQKIINGLNDLENKYLTNKRLSTDR